MVIFRNVKFSEATKLRENQFLGISGVILFVVFFSLFFKLLPWCDLGYATVLIPPMKLMSGVFSSNRVAPSLTGNWNRACLLSLVWRGDKFNFCAVLTLVFSCVMGGLMRYHRGIHDMLEALILPSPDACPILEELYYW